MLRDLKLFSLLFIVGITFFSCSKENYESQIPAYISINDISLTTNYATEGSASSKITDAWVYINDDLVGVYELPVKFPVLKEGDVTIKVYAGIKENGIASNRKRYLGYAPYVKEITLVKKETIFLEPSISYEPTVVFSWLEDFENVNLSFLYHADSDTIINKSTLDVKEGINSGQILLDPAMTFFEVTTEVLTGVPLNGSSPVYLELDYKTNQQVIIGVYLDADQYAFFTLNTTTEWKKIYINLVDVISDNFNGKSELKIFFGLRESSSNPFVAAPEILIDNLKVVHF
jgi:hypothetical protein